MKHLLFIVLRRQIFILRHSANVFYGRIRHGGKASTREKDIILREHSYRIILQNLTIAMFNYMMAFFWSLLGAEFDAVGEISAVVLGLFHAFWAYILLGILLGALAAMAGLGSNKIIKGLRGGQ